MLEQEISIIAISNVPDWETLLPYLKKFTNWSDTTVVYAYLERLDTCSLTSQPLAAVSYGATVWEGRVFNDTADVRWVNSQQGFRAWVTVPGVFSKEELQSQEQTVKIESQSFQVNTQERPYYLHGEYWKPSQNGVFLFTEGRFPHKVFEYPLQQVPKEKERAYIVVREYFRQQPDWNTVDDIELALDQPLLVAHRFISVNSGEGE